MKLSFSRLRAAAVLRRSTSASRRFIWEVFKRELQQDADSFDMYPWRQQLIELPFGIVSLSLSLTRGDSAAARPQFRDTFCWDRAASENVDKSHRIAQTFELGSLT